MNTWNTLLCEQQHDELIKTAIDIVETDEAARRAYLRAFLSPDAMYLLSNGTIKMLHEKADEGLRYAQYGYARYLTSVMPKKSSLRLAYQYATKAMEQGLADAKAMVTAALDFGDMGEVDHEKAEQLRQEAINEGSELATIYHIKILGFGSVVQPANPDKALEVIDTMIARDEAAGIEPNGWYYYLRGSIKEDQIGRCAMEDDYLRALSLGVSKAYYDLMLIHGYGDYIYELNETEMFCYYLEEGLKHRYAGAYHMDALRLIEKYHWLMGEYAAFEPLHDCLVQIDEQLTTGARLGSQACMEQLGDFNYHGRYGFLEDYDKAFEYYDLAARHDRASSAEKLWDMMHYHYIDKPLDYQDYIAITGARLGSKKLLAETVIAKQEGRLQDYSDEIEKYYEPIFDSDDFTLDNDIEEADDDIEEPDGMYDAWA